MFAVGAALGTAMIGAAASLKDDDTVAMPLLLAACCAWCSAILSIRLSLEKKAEPLWLRDVSGFAVLFLVLAYPSARKRKGRRQNQDQDIEMAVLNTQGEDARRTVSNPV
ncbi:hypothetical protein PG984_014192 [Apiospora sp. TS-2023a]